jgi:hypothetical protein
MAENSKDNPKKINRRQFLFQFLPVTGAAIAATGLGIKFAMQNEQIKLDARIEKWKKIAALPPTPETKNLKRAFLKFNAAEIYAQQQGWPLTAEAIERFLTGNGEAWNITQSLLNALQHQFNLENPDELWSLFTSNVMKNAFRDPKNFHSNPKKRKIIENIKASKKFRMNLTAATQLDLSDDYWYSLYRFQIKGNTTVTNSVVKTHSGGILTLTNSNLSLSDTYDWHKDLALLNIQESLSAYDLISQGAKHLGLANPDEIIIDSFGYGPIETLKMTNIVSIGDKDGLMLQESKIFKPYSIYSDPIQSIKPTNVEIHPIFFE